jgi:hypothetical protein
MQRGRSDGVRVARRRGRRSLRGRVEAVGFEVPRELDDAFREGPKVLEQRRRHV